MNITDIMNIAFITVLLLGSGFLRNLDCINVLILLLWHIYKRHQLHKPWCCFEIAESAGCRYHLQKRKGRKKRKELDLLRFRKAKGMRALPFSIQLP